MGGGRGLTPLNAIPIFTYSLHSELFTHGDSRLRVGVDTVCGDNGTVYTGDNNLDFSLFISPDTYHLYDGSVVIRLALTEVSIVRGSLWISISVLSTGSSTVATTLLEADAVYDTTLQLHTLTPTLQSMYAHVTHARLHT